MLLPCIWFVCVGNMCQISIHVNARTQGVPGTLCTESPPSCILPIVHHRAISSLGKQITCSRKKFIRSECFACLGAQCGHFIGKKKSMATLILCLYQMCMLVDHFSFKQVNIIIMKS